MASRGTWMGLGVRSMLQMLSQEASWWNKLNNQVFFHAMAQNS